MNLKNEWLHWAEDAGFRFEPGFRLEHHNRYWRVNASGNFECSCPLEHFDRWANSTGARWEGVPQTEAEFLRAVEQLIEESKV